MKKLIAKLFILTMVSAGIFSLLNNKKHCSSNYTPTLYLCEDETYYPNTNYVILALYLFSK